MLGKINRLSLRTERARLEKKGQVRHSPLFTIVRADSPLGLRAPARFALLISKKIAPLSVERHRLKRLISETIRLNLNEFPKGKDVLIIPQKKARSSTREQIITDLKQLCS